MGHTVILSGKPFLGGTQYGGFLYFRHTFQVNFLSYFHIDLWSIQYYFVRMLRWIFVDLGNFVNNFIVKNNKLFISFVKNLK
jgi:hypothetical protein